MPNVRHTPKRRRVNCPSCGRNISYTNPWIATFDTAEPTKRDAQTLLFREHNTPQGQPCTVNGRYGLGYRVETSC